ncbi:Protein of unknown function [Draconibacterium orientale]|jgi:hypothetical protein|uniref:Uncharacterized protein n=1 Tax=Draconibacterium orientale TaxID=1168034 RepID=A0A1I0JFB6_9BACT|nr:DUF2867 domain-containing protein [Draconibacterium orientale]SEU08128.1 Protein of unknown function [Draconibacterium orientale]
MRILLTGATGHIGKRLLPVLLHKGLWGRMYWYLYKPLRSLVFKRMLANIVKG